MLTSSTSTARCKLFKLVAQRLRVGSAFAPFTGGPRKGIGAPDFRRRPYRLPCAYALLANFSLEAGRAERDVALLEVASISERRGRVRQRQEDCRRRGAARRR